MICIYQYYISVLGVLTSYVFICILEVLTCYVFIFEDNGGEPKFGGSNWPLRGVKHELWEGGIRGVAFVSGPVIPHQVRGTVNHQLMHISDWFPTLLHLAGSDVSDDTLDGFNVWHAIR